MVGALLLIFAMAIVGPVGLFAVGAIWSALTGWGLSEYADDPSAFGPSEVEASEA